MLLKSTHLELLHYIAFHFKHRVVSLGKQKTRVPIWHVKTTNPIPVLIYTMLSEAPHVAIKG